MKTYTDSKPTIPMWLLSRLAPRALRVVNHHQEEHPLIAVFQHTLPAKAADFTERYGAILGDGNAAVSRTDAAHTSVTELLALARGWAGLLQRDLPDVELSPQSKVPDDVLVAIERMLDQVEPHIADGTLPYGEALMDDLGNALEAARADWSAAQSKLADTQTARAELRIAANRLIDELKALRNALRATLGTAHRDYQKLRTTRARITDIEDTPEPDSNEPTEVSKVTQINEVTEAA